MPAKKPPRAHILQRKGVIFLTTEKLFDLRMTIAAALFEAEGRPWEALAGLGDFIMELGAGLDGEKFLRRGDVWISREASVSPSAHISGPCIVDSGAQLRHGAFIRGRALIGKGCVVGNSTEIKNALLFDGAQAPHFNYVGDSILGSRAHLGAGAVTANLRLDRALVTSCGVSTGLRKLGAMVGDRAEIGCGAVLCPGCVVGRGALVYPLSTVRGHVPENAVLRGGSRPEREG